MTPLVRSLIALGALLAAADVVMAEDDQCTSEEFEPLFDVFADLTALRFPPGGGRVEVPWDLCPAGYFTSIQQIKACGQESGPPKISYPGRQPGKPHWVIDVQCPDGCRLGGNVFVTENCLRITGP